MDFIKVNPLGLTYLPGSKIFTMKTEGLVNKEVLAEVMASCHRAFELQLQFEKALTGEE
ncbi:hypothetical protein T4B_14890 [Trichinella pseudospiralis]|uniref:Uncharacterized protein n=1 Tax=Trichinella pseudospiralis TaxID=6337 RepID=A0A0V1GG43_TRIPS|nr:hypothetical protein T4B_14890 [Trichinella pseudospiralis]KRY97175.1 hypothetical protein T4C_11312 [Trichinella pseudospiralis]